MLHPLFSPVAMLQRGLDDVRCAFLVPPEVLEPPRRQRRIAGGILDIAVPEVGLQGSRIDAVVGQLEPAGMTQHVRVRLDPQVGGNPGTLDHAVKALS